MSDIERVKKTRPVAWAQEGEPDRRTLLHFSEDPSVKVFHPHVAKARESDEEPLVWAVDTDHAPLYWFPRDCPRIAFWPNAATTADDETRFLALTASRRVHVIESGWLRRMRDAKLYVYRFDAGAFELHEGDAETGH